MKIGDKVRFLNDVGGGVIAGFPDKQTVLVRDDDGFEIPTLRREVVVIDTNDYNIAVKKTAQKPQPEAAGSEHEKPTSLKRALQADLEVEEADTDPSDAETAYRPMAVERRGGDELNLFLAFVPQDARQIANTRFEAYIINDCNYYVRYAIYGAEEKACYLRFEGELAPNTKLFLAEFSHAELQEWEHTYVQCFSYKREKSFLMKPAMSVNVRIDATKFFKFHTFQPSDFFNEPSLLFDVIRGGKAARTLFVDADNLAEAMHAGAAKPTVAAQPAASGAEKRAAKKSDRNVIIEVDLHANELLDTLAGLSAKDILDYQLKVFRDTMNEHLRERGRRIVFIHGKGDGVLRNALLRELRNAYKQCRHQDASFREYGFGATMVTI